MSKKPRKPNVAKIKRVMAKARAQAQYKRNWGYINRYFLEAALANQGAALYSRHNG